MTILRSAAKLMFVFILGLCFTEAMFRAFDPLGIAMRYADTRDMIQEPNEAGINIAAHGVYHLTESIVTIDENGRRVLPATNTAADCTIAWIGDSVTFGWGVSDDETFANRVARELQDVTFINAAAPAADNLHLLWLKQHTRADGYIHLIWENDAQDIALKGKERSITFNWADREIYLWWHIKSIYARAENPPAALNMPDFWRALDGIAGEDTLLFVLESNPLKDDIVARYPEALVIGWQYDVISWADSHPNAAGHEQAARLMLPVVESFISRICQ